MLEKRAVDCDRDILARDLLAGFYEVCMRTGLDGVLAELEQAFAQLDLSDGFTLADDARLRTPLAERLERKSEFDPYGPGNAKPRQLIDCLCAVLSVTLTDEADRTVTLPDALRTEITAALAAPVDIELAAARLRETTIAKGRALCDVPHHQVFDRIAAVLDERGARVTRQPKLPLDAVQVVQRALSDARHAILADVANTAIDRAKAVLARAEPELAARIEAPITLRLTPRDVAIRRAGDARVGMMPAAVVRALLDSLSDSLAIAWRAPERLARPYAASQKFAVGDLVDHPKFGRGSVLTAEAQRIEVEFPDGKHTLAHAR